MKQPLVLIALFVGFALQSMASILTVLNTNDSGAGSLRDAVLNSSPGDTIRFTPSLVSSSNAMIQLQSEIVIDKPLTIVGQVNGSFRTIIDGNDATRLLRINISSGSKNVVLDSLQLQNGKPAASGQMGGGIRMQGIDTLFLLHSTIRSCESAYGGAIGGAFYTFPHTTALWLDQSIIADNSTTASGGGIYLVGEPVGLMVHNTRIDSNTAGTRGGGVLFDTGEPSEIILSSSQFYRNTANGTSGDGGALCLRPSNGGSIDLMVTDSTLIKQNDAGSQGSGGGIYLGSGNWGTGIVDLTINNGSTFENNHAGDDGGGVYIFSSSLYCAFSVRDARFDLNTARDGGGIHADGIILDTLKNVHFTQNSASISGGAFFLNHAFNGTGGNQPLIVVNSLFDDNHAIQEGGAIWSNQHFIGKHSRFINNHCNNDGGFLALTDFIAAVDLDSCTVSDNEAGGSGGAFYVDYTGQSFAFDFLFDSVRIERNHAGNDGGFLYITAIHPDIDMSYSHCVLDSNTCGSQGGSVFVHHFYEGVTLTVDSSSFSNGYAGGDGGAFYLDLNQHNLDFNHSHFASNTCDSLGGFMALELHANTGAPNSHTIRIDTSVIENCESGFDGGALYVSAREWSHLYLSGTELRSNTAGRDGGAIFHFSQNNAYTYFENSTASHNEAGDDGGVIYTNLPYNFYNAHAYINAEQSTFWENHADGNGGAIYSQTVKGSSVVDLENASLINNNSFDTASSVYTRITGVGASEIKCTSSIIYGAGNTNLFNSKPLTVNSYGYNIFSDEPQGVAPNSLTTASDFFNVDSSSVPFGPLQLNGGITRTSLPLAGSIAINAGNPMSTDPAQNDTIYLIRDIGAAESDACELYTYPKVSACDSFAWAGTGQLITNSGIYTDTFQNQYSCDSVVTMDLMVHPSTSFTYSTSTCNQFFWNANGQIYYESDTVSVVLVNSNGCDSVAHLNLTIRNSAEVYDTVEVCGNYTWPANGQTYYTNTTETFQTSTSEGCDSTMTLYLTVNPLVNAFISDSSSILTATPGMASYQWFSCDTSGLNQLSGATSSTYPVTANGDYAVMVENNGCADTSECFSINYLGVEDQLWSQVSIYPNPTNGSVQIDLGQHAGAEIRVFNSIGQVIAPPVSIRRTGEWLEIPGDAGIYIVEVNTEGRSERFQVIKQ